MKKILTALLVLILVFGGAAWYFVTFKLDNAIEHVIENSGSVALSSAVRVGSVETSIRDGSLKISSLTIANPPGYKSDYALDFAGIEAALDYDGFEIDRIVIDNPGVTIEERGGKSNFGDMLAGMNRGEASEPVPEGIDEPIITIRHFRMNETTAAFISGSFDTESELNVKAIELNDIKGTPTEVANIIAREIIGEVSSVAATEIIKSQAKKKLGLDKASEDESVGDKLKGLIGGGKDDSGN